VDSLDEQVARCLDEQWARNKELGSLLPDLPHEVNGITALIHTQERARDELLAAKQELDRHSLDRKHVADSMDASRRDVDSLSLQLAGAKTRAERAEQVISVAVTRLEAAADTLAWPELKQAAAEGEPGPLIGARRGLRRSEQETAIGLAARLESEVDRVQRGIPIRREKAE
jgi:hypothetical protein